MKTIFFLLFSVIANADTYVLQMQDGSLQVIESSQTPMYQAPNDPRVAKVYPAPNLTEKDGSVLMIQNGQPAIDTAKLAARDQALAQAKAASAQLQSDLTAAAASVDSFLSKSNPTNADLVIFAKAMARLQLKK